MRESVPSAIRSPLSGPAKTRTSAPSSTRRASTPSITCVERGAVTAARLPLESDDAVLAGSNRDCLRGRIGSLVGAEDGDVVSSGRERRAIKWRQLGERTPIDIDHSPWL